jgi:RHS repeat-associated protein
MRAASCLPSYTGHFDPLTLYNDAYFTEGAGGYGFNDYQALWDRCCGPFYVSRLVRMLQFHKVTSYFHDGFGVVYDTAGGSGSNNYVRVPDTGEVAAWISNGSQLTVPIQDRIGSTVGLVGSSGGLGTRTEQDTGLYHLQYRFYSPGLARFISQDPLGVSGSGVNLFAYANDDPVNQVDPLGLASYCLGDCAGGETNQNPSGGGGFPSLFSSIIGFFEDLFGGGSSRPTRTAKESLGREHKPMVILVGAEADIGPNQHNSVALPAGLLFVKFTVPPSGCSYYDARCATRPDDRYACTAGQCCRDWGNNPGANCVRNCLIERDLQSCLSQGSLPSTDACREASHFGKNGCFRQCGGMPGLPPISCLKPLWQLAP